jgi:flagellar biosynthesis component FlhA
MLRVLIPALLIALVAAIVASRVRRKNRLSGDATPELHKHPERLSQSLDPTDDA